MLRAASLRRERERIDPGSHREGS